jgi:streptogrisin B
VKEEPVPISPAPHRLARTIRILAAAVGLAAASALSLPAAATAAPSAPSASQLAGVRAAVADTGIGGIAWYTDTAAHRVVVTADSTVSAGEIATIRKAAGDTAAVHVTRTAGVFRPLLSAGAAIYGGQYRCSLGFNVVKGGTYYFLTAGHCGQVADTWYTDSGHRTLIGPTVGYTFPGHDYALVRYDNSSLSHPGGFTAANAYVGESVKRTGSTSGTHSGTVTALDVTVHYSGGGGTVRGLIQTTVCAEPGDSGGPMYDGSKGLGITSGGSGDCTSGGTTFFQPLPQAANAYGVTVY